MASILQYKPDPGQGRAHAPVAQLAEHQTSNLRAAGSRPVRRSSLGRGESPPSAISAARLPQRARARLLHGSCGFTRRAIKKPLRTGRGGAKATMLFRLISIQCGCFSSYYECLRPCTLFYNTTRSRSRPGDMPGTARWSGFIPCGVRIPALTQGLSGGVGRRGSKEPPGIDHFKSFRYNRCFCRSLLFNAAALLWGKAGCDAVIY